MRRHTTRSGATRLVALSLIATVATVATACGEKGTSGPDLTAPTTPSALALTRAADTLAVDESVQLNAIVPLLPGSPPPITWSSSDENVAIVTRAGVVFAIKSGKATITVTSRGVSASTRLTIRPTVRDIKFMSDTIGISLSDSVRLPYRAIDSDGQPLDLSAHTVEWSSTSPDIAPITGNETVTGRSIGIASVTLRVDSKSATTNVHVLQKPVATVAVAPASVAVLPGQELALAATTYDVSRKVLTGRAVTWTSANTAVATVSATGLVKGVAAGKVNVTALSEGQSTVVPVTVTASSSSTTAAPVASIAVSLNAASIVAGQSTQANAVLKDGSNNVLTGRTLAWSSSDATVATVSATGMVSALKAGTATITAVAEGKTGTAALTVTAPASAPAPVASVAVALSASSAVLTRTAQASATLKDAAGTVLTGRTVTWVSSDASIASVDGTGLVTAQKAGSVTITASAEGSTGTAMFTATALAPVVTAIALTSNATTLKIGELGQVSGVVKDANGNVISSVPIFWSSSPTSVASISSMGAVTGRGVGTATIYAKADTVTRSISVAVIDSATSIASAPSPSGSAGTPTGSYSTATIAELPRLSVSTTYPSMSRQVRVAAGADLQAAINAAQPGDELLLAPGATYVGNFWLPNKGASTSWIVLRTDLTDASLGSAGTRMTPSRASTLRLARIQSPNGQPALDTDLGAHHYRFTGVEIGVTSGAADINALVRFGSDASAQNSPSTTANNLVVDRSYVHGAPTLDLRRCVLLNSATSAVVDSWLADCHSNISDSQAIIGWNGPGPFLIQNNHLEAGHEVVVFGGGTFTVTNGSPSDITIRGNHFTRPVSWKGVWQVKNLFETKHVKRLLLEGNVMENNWADAQDGFALVIKSENQQGDNNWTTSQDITVRYNLIRCTGSGISIAGAYSNTDSRLTVLAARITVTDNLVDQMNTGSCTAAGIAWRLLNGLQDASITHNTVRNAAQSMETIVFDGDRLTRLVYAANASYNGQYGVYGSTNPAIPYFAPGGFFSDNVLVGGNVYPQSCSSYPTTNSCPSTMPSTFSMAGDGRAIGADLTKVNSATSSSVVAP